MNFKALSILTFISCASVFSYAQIIELQLTQVNGFGNLNSGFSAMTVYSENDDSETKKSYLKTKGAPENWNDPHFGEIETNFYQDYYLKSLSGEISKDDFNAFQERANWRPNEGDLSKEPLKTKIAFAYGKDDAGAEKMIVDANNNLDFSDDQIFIPYSLTDFGKFSDSVAESSQVIVSFERFSNNKTQTVSAPLIIMFAEEIGIYMNGFAQYSIAEIDGQKLAVTSDDFTNLSYHQPKIALLSDTLTAGDKISAENLFSKNEFLEINGIIYKSIGVNTNRNTLILEKLNTPKSQLYSTQIGYQSFAFEGNNFRTKKKIKSEDLKGKYVLIDFWAVWCGPCLQEIPNLKSLYEKTDRSKFEIISIVGDSPEKSLKKLIKKQGITWPQITSDELNKIKETFGVNGYPTTFLLDQNGVVIAKDLRGEQLEEKILSLVGEKK